MSASLRHRLPVRVMLLAVLPLLFVMSLATGPASLTWSEVIGILSGWDSPSSGPGIILFESRLPRALTALGAGAGLALCGLMMQTLFRNPLAGPSILGITSGASLAVALLILGQGVLWSSSVYPSSGWVATAAMLGAAAILAVVMAVSGRLGNTNSLLLFGILLGHFVGAVESVLQHRNAGGAVRAFVVWGMGRFSDTTVPQAALLIGVVGIAAFVLYRLATSMNLYLLGETYAESMGLRRRRFQWMMVGITGILAGLITAWCGPVAFIGLAMPHVARMVLRTSNHRVLLVPLLVIGASAGLLSDLIGKTFSLPLNAVTSLIGVPVVIAVIFQSGKTKSVV